MSSSIPCNVNLFWGNSTLVILMGRPVSTSWGERPVTVWDMPPLLIIANGSTFTHFRLVLPISLLNNTFFRVWFAEFYCTPRLRMIGTMGSQLNLQSLWHGLSNLIHKISTTVGWGFLRQTPPWYDLSQKSLATAAAEALVQGKALTHFENMSTITKQYLFSSQGVNSMKSIIKCSKGPSGLRWDTGDTTRGIRHGGYWNTASNIISHTDHTLLQKYSAKTVNPTVLQYLFTRSTIPPFNTWSRPCDNLARYWKVQWGMAGLLESSSHTPEVSLRQCSAHLLSQSHQLLPAKQHH